MIEPEFSEAKVWETILPKTKGKTLISQLFGTHLLMTRPEHSHRMSTHSSF